MIEIKNLTKTFEKTKALNDISFSVANGSVFGLVGSNGSGKSTLLRIMAGVFQPDSGMEKRPLKITALRKELLMFPIILISFRVLLWKVWQDT